MLFYTHLEFIKQNLDWKKANFCTVLCGRIYFLLSRTMTVKSSAQWISQLILLTISSSLSKKKKPTELLPHKKGKKSPKSSRQFLDEIQYPWKQIELVGRLRVQRGNMHYRKWPNKTSRLPLLPFSSGIAWVMLGPARCFFFFFPKLTVACLDLCSRQPSRCVGSTHGLHFLNERTSIYSMAWVPLFCLKTNKRLYVIIFINLLQQSRTLPSLHQDLLPEHNVWSSVVLGLGLQHISVLSSLCVIATVIRLAIIIKFSSEKLRSWPRRASLWEKLFLNSSSCKHWFWRTVALKSNPFLSLSHPFTCNIALQDIRGLKWSLTLALEIYLPACFMAMISWSGEHNYC